jgi:hypothetical protein
MKKLILFFAVITFCKQAFAQKELVTLDEHNKYIFYQLVDMPGITADTLYSRTLIGVKTNKLYKSSNVINVANTSITLKSKTMLYTSMAVAKHESGELNYTLVMEFKDNKYRYWLTDFVFMPYERTRYGVYAKIPGVSYTLEEAKTKVDTKIFDTYLEQIAKFGKETGENMNIYTTTPQKKVTQPAKTDTRKW